MRYIISFLLASTSLGSAAWAEAPSVVTDIPPLHSLAAAVMQGVGEPVLLLEKGASEHHYQLKPSQAAAIAEADLVIWIGPELTPWLESALANRPADAATLGMLTVPGTYVQAFAEAEADHDHADHDDHDAAGKATPEAAADGHEEDHEAGHDEGHDDGHDHDHSGTDPHAWLDPANGQVWARAVAAELSRLDPENAATYAANAETAVAAIATAEQEAAALLAPVKDRPLIAFHDAYGYFTGHFGLTMAGTVALGDASVPGAQRLVGLKELVAAGKVACLFPEVQHDPVLIAQLAEGTDVAVGAALDPAGASMEPGPALYPALLVSLAQSIADCSS